MSWRELAKKRAAKAAVQHVKDGFVVGLGTGTTASYAIKEIGSRIRNENIDVYGVPTSHQAAFLAIQENIRLVTLDEHPTVNLTIDGADQIDKNLNVIKGGGAAMLREKIVASASKDYIIIADESKLVDVLGVGQPVPIEVLPFAATYVKKRLEKIAKKVTIREGSGKAGPILTDNGNFIVDGDFGPILDPQDLELTIATIPGTVETGLFIRMLKMAYIGRKTAHVRRIYPQ